MTISVEIESGTTQWAIMVTDFFLEKCYVKNKIYVECTKNSWERIIIELKHYLKTWKIFYQYFICKFLQLDVIVIRKSL